MMESTDWIPQHVRAWVYRVLGIVWGLEAVFDWVPSGAEQRVAAALAVFGFSLAAIHTPTKES
jgi:hypothetical protein